MVTVVGKAKALSGGSSKDAAGLGPVAVGTATPEQRKIAKNQRRFIVVKEPYYPTVEDRDT